jgi:hypothetical protein
MRLSEQMLARAGKGRSPDEVEALVLDNMHVGTVTTLASYKKLRFLSLRYNQLKSIAFVSSCPQLWVLELQQNLVLLQLTLQIADYLPLRELGVLGYLSCSVTSALQLQQLRDLHVIELKVVTPLSRPTILATLPRSVCGYWIDVWIVNNEFVSHEERTAPIPSSSSSSSPSGPSYGPMLATMTDARKKAYTELCTSFHECTDVYEAEQLKLDYIIQDLDYRCELDWNRSQE